MRIVPHPEAAEIFTQCYIDRASEMSPDVMLEKLTGWEVNVIKTDLGIIGAVARRNGEFHFGILQEFRGQWGSRARFQQIIDWAAESGAIKTGATTGSLGEKMAEYMGLRAVARNERGKFYVYP